MKGDTISRSALIKAFHTDIVNHMQYIDDSTVSVCIAEIEEAPTVAAAPEVHGRWEYREDVLTMDGIKNFYQCSNCEKSVTEETFDDEWSMDFDRCPSCGARMDGGEEE